MDVVEEVGERKAHTGTAPGPNVRIIISDTGNGSSWSSHTVNMPQFLNEKILNERWKELLFIVGHIFSTNLISFQSRTIGYLDLFNIFTYFLCL